jgi:hypothetical protein
MTKQNTFYLTGMLLNKGCDITALFFTTDATDRTNQYIHYLKLFLHYGDLADMFSRSHFMRRV